jgi:hypothetical protein
LNFAKYLQITLPIIDAHLIFRFCWTFLSGNNWIKSMSFKGICELFVSNDGSLIMRFRIAYCWVQWMERFVCVWLWIFAWILMSMLSPTSLHKKIKTKRHLTLNGKNSIIVTFSKRIGLLFDS